VVESKPKHNILRFEAHDFEFRNSLKRETLGLFESVWPTLSDGAIDQVWGARSFASVLCERAGADKHDIA